MEGFEPPIPLPVYTISSRAHSTALPHLRAWGIIQVLHTNARHFIRASVRFPRRLKILMAGRDRRAYNTRMAKSFNEQVYDIVARIPAGRVVTFGQIARMIGRPRMARFVGYASNNKNSWHLSWHRVVFKDGRLIPGYEAEQYKSLRSEGVKFNRDKTVKMDEFQWNPERDGVPLDIRDFPLVF